MKVYFWRVLVAFDVFMNVVFRGNPDETISARAATARNGGKIWGCILCKLLDRFQKNHCDLAIQTDKERAENARADLDRGGK